MFHASQAERRCCIRNRLLPHGAGTNFCRRVFLDVILSEHGRCLIVNHSSENTLSDDLPVERLSDKLGVPVRVPSIA